MITPDLSRRDLLLSGAALPFAGRLPRRARAARRRDDTRANRIIFMVSDGMSAGVPSLAEPFSQLVRGRETTWHALARDPDTVRGYLETASLDSMVTDSAAASSAWGSGSRVANWSVNTLPDGTPLRPIAHLAKERGRAVGLVTTTTITHATPAGFAAVHRSRDAQAAIAEQYVDVVDVALGGGQSYFDALRRPDGRDLRAAYAAAGYDVCTDRSELSRAAGSRLLGLFAPGHLPYTVDQVHRPEDHAGVPTLREMTRAALARLSAADDGFLLQVEGGRVDHAAHENDAAGLLWDQLAFDDAVAEVLAYAREQPDTLVVVTTDHGNANPGLNGIGTWYRSSTASFERVASIRSSFETIGAALAADGGHDAPRPDDAVIATVREHTGITLAPAEARAVALARAGRPTGELNAQHAGFVGTLGQALANHTGIAWTGITHTSELALTLAVGPGSEHFAGVMHHTDVFDVLTGLMGIEHRNPRAETPAG